jgi:hypothetical protein
MDAVVVLMWREEVVGGGSRDWWDSRSCGICGGFGGAKGVEEVCAPWQSPQEFEVMCRGAMVVSCDARCPSIRRAGCLCNPRVQLRIHAAATPPSAYHGTKYPKSHSRVYRRSMHFSGVEKALAVMNHGSSSHLRYSAK